jgi:phosphatidylglycerol:prolipoprotein diacylglycerol transferase
MIHQGGLVFYGGLIGASAAFIWQARHKHLPIWKGADILAPSICLGYVFGRIGCLMTGCCFGRVCDLPWAIHFPVNSPAFLQQRSDSMITADATRSLGVHPTQLYESGLNLLAYVALAWLYRRKKFDGQVFAAYLLTYSVLRSFVEVFRGDYPQHYLGGLATPAHLVSAGVFALGLVLYASLRGGQSSPSNPTQVTS